MKRFLLLSLLLLAACSGADVLNAVIPHNGYALHQDIVYGKNLRQHLDIYVPDKASPSADVILFFYGGAWNKGSKDLYRFVGQAFASKGYITVVADYRIYPEVYFPSFVEDGAQALVWVHQHIDRYGGNPNRVFLAGHSAGAHIAAMLTLNSQYIKAAGGKRSWIAGMIGLAGPYDFLPLTDPEVRVVFSKTPEIEGQPIHFVKPGMPPILLLTGDEDEDVEPKNTRNLAATLRQFGNPVSEKIYPGIAHTGIVLALANGFRSKAPVLQDIDNFITASTLRNRP